MKSKRHYNKEQRAERLRECIDVMGDVTAQLIANAKRLAEMTDGGYEAGVRAEMLGLAAAVEKTTAGIADRVIMIERAIENEQLETLARAQADGGVN